MGMFTTILGPFAECQIKTGWDNCDTYKIGDKIPWTPSSYRPGDHIDGVHLGYGACDSDTLVVIKDCTVAAMLPRRWDKYLDVQIATLKLDYGLGPPARSLWSEEAWAEKEAHDKEMREEQEKWDREHAHLTPEEKMAAITGEYLKRKMNEQSLARQLFPPSVHPEEKIKYCKICKLPVDKGGLGDVCSRCLPVVQGIEEQYRYQSIEEDLVDLINRQSRENRSNTPDFILAQFMARCLKAFEDAVNARDSFYGIHPEPGKHPGDHVSMKGPMTAEEEAEYVAKAQKKLKEMEEELTRPSPGQMFGRPFAEGAMTEWLNHQKVQKAVEEKAVTQQARHIGGKTFSYRCDQCGEAITMPVSADPATHKSVCPGPKGTFRYGQVPVDPEGTIRTTVSNCARCGGTHENLRFTKLSGEPIGDQYTHWATCPKTGEPIVLLITMQNGEKGYAPN